MRPCFALPSRLSVLLRSAGFDLTWESIVTGASEYARSSNFAGLFEQVIVLAAGRHKEAVGAYAQVSLTRTRARAKDLFVREPILTIASVPERGWSILKSARDARTWEEKLASVADDECARISATYGHDLLERTKAARSMVDHYWAHVAGVANLTEWLTSKSEEQDRVDARRILECPGVVQVESGREEYFTAVLVILILDKSLDFGYSGTHLANPIADTRLFQCIQLLADRIMTYSRSA